MDATSKPKLLIVDDSRIVRVTLIKHVKELYTVREESDGEAGWASLLADNEIAVVISDLGMPKLDGYGFLQRVRESTDARIRNVPFVIISGEEDEKSRVRAKALGASDFITKGIGTAELLARLDSLVKLTRAQDVLAATQEHYIAHPRSGLNTRRYIEAQAVQTLSHAARHGLATSVLVVGLDRLPTITAEFGQALADELLIRFGKLLAGKVRTEDSLGHFGETTYAVVSPSTGDDGASIFASRLRDAVAQANVAYQGRKIALSVSIGIASTPPEPAADATSLLALAAARADEAAAAGGNRIVASAAVTEDVTPPLLVDPALALLRAGRDTEVLARVARLGCSVLPLLRIVDRECRLGLPLKQIEAILRERAQAEKTPDPDVLSSPKVSARDASG